MSHAAPVPLDPFDFPSVTLVRPPVRPALDRRRARRRPARPGARAEVRPRSPAAPDLAVGLLDVSEAGVRVRLVVPITTRDPVEVTLRDPAGAVCATTFGAVRWWALGRDGTAVAGLEFDRELAPEVVARLVAPAVDVAGPISCPAG